MNTLMFLIYAEWFDTHQRYCKNNIGAIPISGSVLFAAGAGWTGGPGGAFGNPGSLTTTYTPSPTDIDADSVILYLTSAGSLFSCPDHVDSVVIRFTPSPIEKQTSSVVPVYVTVTGTIL